VLGSSFWFVSGMPTPGISCMRYAPWTEKKTKNNLTSGCHGDSKSANYLHPPCQATNKGMSSVCFHHRRSRYKRRNRFYAVASDLPL
jgi:hypothetical protein